MLGKKKMERGQAIVLLTLAIVSLVGFTALAIDGGNAYSNNRQAQNAADTAALSAALAKIRNNDWNATALNITASNGFDDNDSSVTVTVHNPPQSGAYANCSSTAYDCNEYIQVIIESEVETFFAPVVGIDTTNNRVEAVARAKPATTQVLFNGNAVVGLNPRASRHGSNPCGFDTGNSNADKWILEGGGIFSNGCAYSKNNDSVTLPHDKCVTTVTSADGFTCSQPNQSALAYSTEDIAAMMPPTPACDDTAEGGYNIETLTSGHHAGEDFNFINGIYCIDDFEILFQDNVIVNNATIYVTDTDFDVKFAAGHGFGGTAPASGPYEGYYLIIEMSNTPCERYQDHGSQSIEFRGHSSIGIVGTILAPTACIDFRGNSNGEVTHSQVIGYNVTSNGNADVFVSYNPEENATAFISPQIELAE
ncbi:MAG: hypothetical protein HN855_12285 [Anaerolineae bacterium]|jgi:hypothetical protein|nr:hypothetical protein [Anaerolineae bacterium]MBT7071308.1 hypothetical protein [Anaerolineae bacterium]MBT7325932.1 hypothetical protein [Anaerolineae bacterium]